MSHALDHTSFLNLCLLCRPSSACLRVWSSGSGYVTFTALACGTSTPSWPRCELKPGSIPFMGVAESMACSLGNMPWGRIPQRIGWCIRRTYSYNEEADACTSHPMRLALTAVNDAFLLLNEPAHLACPLSTCRITVTNRRNTPVYGLCTQFKKILVFRVCGNVLMHQCVNAPRILVLCPCSCSWT